MPEPIVVRVDNLAEFMSEADFKTAIDLMDGSLAQEGNDFQILHVVAPDPGRARKAFADKMTDLLGESNNQLVWRYKPEIGTRREDANIVYVCSARFRIDAPQPETPDDEG